MRILFLHPNFPAQFRHVAAAIARDRRHQVVFGTTRRDGQLSGVYKAIYQPTREAGPQTHPYVRSLETAVLQGQAVYRMADQLKARGFVPDVVYGHSGWGPTLFTKDIFPNAQLLCYFEWFYHARGSDADFDPADPMTADSEARIRIKNTPILTDLYSCDRGLSPTYWQRQQFPKEYQSKISVLHDGVDTEFFRPKPGAKLVLPRLKLDLSHVEELVTYVGRGMEPYRGFPQLIETVALLQQQRPKCHVVIVGEDRVAYGKPRTDGKTHKEYMLEQFPLDMSRVHFTGSLPYQEYRQVLQASDVHLYLTRPFVLSWSMLEALAMGCLVVGSNTAPVTEVIREGENGLLVDFFSPVEIADRISEVLDHPDRMQAIRTKARETVLQRYDLAQLLPQHLQWIQQSLERPLIFAPAKSQPELDRAIGATDTDNTDDRAPAAFTGANHANGANNSQPAPSAEVVLQVGNRRVTAQELLPLLSQYQLLPKLWQESVIDEAIAAIACTPEEQEQCCQAFYAQQQLTTESARQTWLQQQGLTSTHLVNLATRKLRIEKFKQATWGGKLESYFLQYKQRLDQVVYSLIRVREASTAQELFFRLQADEQSFAELARQYSEGAEAQAGGLMGPVPLSTPHPKLAQLLMVSQVGQVSPPARIGEWWVIVRLEQTLPAQLDAPMRQRLLDELFAVWLKEQLQQPAAIQIAKVAAQPSATEDSSLAPAGLTPET
jgi:glycosyltransferase involved in cell wall biosynthesis/parvulin-like peptidyl-prolyl isomerase